MKKDASADMAIDSDSDSDVDEPKGKDELELTLDDMTEKAAKRKIAKLKGPKVRIHTGRFSTPNQNGRTKRIVALFICKPATRDHWNVAMKMTPRRPSDPPMVG